MKKLLGKSMNIILGLHDLNFQDTLNWCKAFPLSLKLKINHLGNCGKKNCSSNSFELFGCFQFA